jgi:hypothetical protein
MIRTFNLSDQQGCPVNLFTALFAIGSPHVHSGMDVVERGEQFCLAMGGELFDLSACRRALPIASNTGLRRAYAGILRPGNGDDLMGEEYRPLAPVFIYLMTPAHPVFCFLEAEPGKEQAYTILSFGRSAILRLPAGASFVYELGSMSHVFHHDPIENILYWTENYELTLAKHLLPAVSLRA